MSIINEILSFVKLGPRLASEIESRDVKSITRGAKEGTLQFPCLIPDSVPLELANVTRKTLDLAYASFAQNYFSRCSTIDVSMIRTPNQFIQQHFQNIKLESVNTEVFEETEASLSERIYSNKPQVYLNKKKNFAILVHQEAASTLLSEDSKYQMRTFMEEFDVRPFPIKEAGPGTKATDIVDSILGRDTSTNTFNKTSSPTPANQVKTPEILDRDVKKMNDFQPYAISIRLTALNQDNQFVQYMDFVIGVKTVMHLIKSQDMIDNCVGVLQNTGKFFNFLKWTSGEVSLVKDLILNLNEVKTDNANVSNGSTAWFQTLKNLKNKKIKLRNGTVPTKVLPTATLVLSTYELNAIRTTYGYDMLNPVIGKKLMDGLFLMGLVLIDDVTMTVEVMYDGDDNYATYSLDALEREVALGSNKLGKEITRMISR